MKLACETIQSMRYHNHKIEKTKIKLTYVIPMNEKNHNNKTQNFVKMG